MSVHRLVALNFIDNPNNYPVVNHIDGNKQNNNVTNLEWCTYSYNNKEAYRLGLAKISMTERKFKQIKELSKRTSKKVIQYDKDYNYINSFPSISEASRKTNFSISHISRCCNNKRITNGYIWEFEKV